MSSASECSTSARSWPESKAIEEAVKQFGIEPAAYERAQLYQRLADELDVISAMRPPPQAPAQPAAQQQHQIQPKPEGDDSA